MFIKLMNNLGIITDLLQTIAKGYLPNGRGGIGMVLSG